MPELADIFRAYGPGYRAKYGQRMLPSHKRAITDIIQCRTRVLGGKAFQCESCNQVRYSYHSCKNRSCTKCGHDDATDWLNKQSASLLPVPYFLLTVTLPKELRPMARSNQKLIYSIMFRTAAAAIQKLARDPKYLGGLVGFFGILQTWARDMGYHVHIHFVVAGGAFSEETKRWLPLQRDYLMPERALAKIFRAKFRDVLKDTELFEQIPEDVWHAQWIVDIRNVGEGYTAIKYLAQYIFKIAISNNRILKFEDGNVTFRYFDNKGHGHTKNVPAEIFMQQFLQHVLPKGFVKIRYYGFLSPRKRDSLRIIQKLFNIASAVSANCSNSSDSTAAGMLLCPRCKQPMVFVAELQPQRNRSP